MATASYLKEPNLSISDKFKPYVTPYESLLKNASTKTELWKMGADRFKSYYDKALNYELTTKSANKIKYDFIDKAQEEIKKASSMDLSIGDNQAKAMNIFTPLFDPTNPTSALLLKDHSLTTFYKDNMNKMESLKKSNSKEYNRDNELYMLDGYNEFSKEQDLNNIDNHLFSKKPYIPYYDVTAEMLKLKEECKGIDSQIDRPNGYYMSELHETGTSAKRLAGCISYGLSPAAKTQLGITAYVSLGKNYDVVKSMYLEQFKEETSTLTKKLLSTEAEIKALGDLKQTAETKEKLNILTKYREDLNNQTLNISKQMEDFNKGDLDFIKKNYEKLASSLYTSKIVNGFASSFADYSTKQILKADTAKLAYTKMQQDWAAMFQKNQFDKENAYDDYMYQWSLNNQTARNAITMAQLKGEIKKPGTLDPDAPNYNYPLSPQNQNTKENVSEGAYNQFESGLAEVSTNIISSYTNLIAKVFSNNDPKKAEMLSLLKPENITQENIDKVREYIDGYLVTIGDTKAMENPIKKEAVDQFRVLLTEQGSKLQLYKKTQQIYESIIDKDQELSNLKKLNSDKNFINNEIRKYDLTKQRMSLFMITNSSSFPDASLELSADRVQSIIEGKDPEIKMKVRSSDGQPIFTINGKEYYTKGGEKFYKNMPGKSNGNIFEAYATNHFKNSMKLQQKRDELYSNFVFALNQEYDITSSNTGIKETEGYTIEKNHLKSLAGLKETDNVRVISTPWNGDVTVTFEPEKKEDIAEHLKPEDIQKRLESQHGVGNIVVLDPTNRIFRIKNWENSAFNDQSIEKNVKDFELKLDSIEKAMETVNSTQDELLQNSEIPGYSYRVNISKSVVNPKDVTYSIEFTKNHGEFRYLPTDKPLKTKSAVISAIKTNENKIKAENKVK